MSDVPTDISIEPVWLVEATYAPDAAETRVPFRAQHLAGIQARKEAGQYIEAGAFADVSASVVLVRASDEAQAIYANTNYEFPVVPSVAPAELTQSWGELKAVSTPLVEVAAHRAEAAALVDELKVNEGAQN